MLEHLILVPQGGLCNRLRAIASALRLCRRLGAKCSLVWNWGNFWHVFAPIPTLDVLSFSPLCVANELNLRDVRVEQRIVNVRLPTLKLRSGKLFWGNDESRIYLDQVRDFLPQLSERLQSIVSDFAGRALKHTVGFHIRRTDNERSMEASPDEVFFAEAETVVAAGKSIFLATDNTRTEEIMDRRFPGKVITYPRRKTLAKRWPRRRFDPVALEDDLLDLFLLARTEYVVGSQFSSFSAIAIVLNGSKKCRQAGATAEARDRAA
jgi:hypothetical protein